MENTLGALIGWIVVLVVRRIAMRRGDPSGPSQPIDAARVL